MRAIVFIVRGCPAGWLGAYGNEWIGTPHLDRLVAEGIAFDRHISDCPEPAAATRAWLGSDTGVLKALRTQGIRTVLVRANHPDTDGPRWFYDGWDEVFDARPQDADNSPLATLIHELPGLLDRLAEVPDFLLWVETDRLLPPWNVRQDVFEAYLDVDEAEEEGSEGHDEEEEEESESDDEADDNDNDDDEAADEPATTDEPVEPWADPPTGPFDASDPDLREWLHNTFAAVVTSLDAELGAVFDELRSRGLDQSAAWLVTSDFGYPLGEHGQVGLHRPWLYEELVHLPLILRLPAAAEACRRVAGFTQPPDVVPTLLDLFGLKPPEGLAGTSLMPLVRGEVESVRTNALTALELGPATEQAIRTEEWAYLLPTKQPEGETREPQLYEKPDDRWEVNDMRPRNIERADELEAELKRQS